MTLIARILVMGLDHGHGRKRPGRSAQTLSPWMRGPADPSFLAFRTRLLEAVKKKDAKFISSLLSPDILNSFGGNGGGCGI